MNDPPQTRAAQDGPVAQLDRASDFYSEGCRFDSCRDRQPRSCRQAPAFIIKIVTFHERVGALAPVFEPDGCALSMRGGRAAPDQGLSMPRAELTRMGIAGAVAIVAISFLALDAVVDVNSNEITKRIEMAQASIADAAMSQHQLASAVQAWAHRGHQKQPSAIE